MKEKKNPFIFMFVCAAMSAIMYCIALIMYCIAFHEERDKVKELTIKLEKYQKK